MTELDVQTLKQNIQQVQERIDAAAKKAGRSASDIHLVAATKMNDAERVRVAIENGIQIAGENRVQEPWKSMICMRTTGHPCILSGHCKAIKLNI